ncbi:hypothetical protein K7X08_001244 [Anisodus acutangulus]|uniref:Uncharacterized protein n=1 Tax=Anisodus acutangulus TaxID=402998 RepID=A0A9Q1RMV0_9SOLA|nr:hypothetical protein K7X08_001244 [Anisodus acutangulus]
MESLLTHIENLAAKTACVSLLDQDLDKERSLSMKFELSRDVIPIKQELAGVYIVLLKGLQQKCEVGGTIRNVVETLHEELRLLVYFLTDPPKEHVEEEKVNEYLIQIEAAIHEIEFIAREVKEVYQRVPRSSMYASPRTNGLGFIDFLLEKLNELLIVKADLIAHVKHLIEAISRELE